MKNILTLKHETQATPRKGSFSDRELAFDVNDLESAENFGAEMLRALEDWPMNKIVHFKWSNKHGASKEPRYIKAWFFGKIQRMVLDKKMCSSCGKRQLCLCHTTCNNCSPCEVERKNHVALKNLGKQIRIELPEDNYDDDVENAIRDTIDSGDYRRADIEEDDEN